MSDLIHWVMIRAHRRYGGTSDGMFNAANFSHAWQDVTGLKSGLDGEAVAAMLHGRNDVVRFKGGAHYQIRSYVEPEPSGWENV